VDELERIVVKEILDLLSAESLEPDSPARGPRDEQRAEAAILAGLNRLRKKAPRVSS